MGNANQRISGIFYIKLAKGKILILSSVGEGKGKISTFQHKDVDVAILGSDLYQQVKLKIKNVIMSLTQLFHFSKMSSRNKSTNMYNFVFNTLLHCYV